MNCPSCGSTDWEEDRDNSIPEDPAYQCLNCGHQFTGDDAAEWLEEEDDD